MYSPLRGDLATPSGESPCATGPGSLACSPASLAGLTCVASPARVIRQRDVGLERPAAGEMSALEFSPATIHAKVGQTITWTNKDTAKHNVTYVSGPRFKSSATIAAPPCTSRSG